MTSQISIHALLAESDTHPITILVRVVEISIHALLAESDPRKTEVPGAIWISIHALLAESDNLWDAHRVKVYKFLSTLSLRRATI